MKTIITILLISCFFSPAIAEEPKAVISGIEKTKDGDGILFGAIEIRLKGIAAPEYNNQKKEPGGLEATQNLRQLVNEKLVTCHLDGTTTGKRSRYRPVGFCYLNGIDINHYQVISGHARDCPRFSKGKYRKAELTAQNSGRNLSSLYKLPNYCNAN